MTVDIDITTGGITHIAVPVTSADFAIPGFFPTLYGWSLREASSAVPADVSGSVVAPGAGATIATTAALAAGTYDVAWEVGLQGAAAAADANNFQLFAGATLLETSVNPGAAGEYAQLTARVTIPAATAISVKALGAGTAAVTYSATITATPDQFIGFTAELQDEGDPCGEPNADFQESSTAWFGPQGVNLNGALKLHVITGTVTGTIYLGL